MTCEELAVEVLGPATDTASFATESFVGLGGDSLRAMRLAALAEERLGVRLSASSLLDDAPLGRVLADAAAGSVPVDKIAGSGPGEQPALDSDAVSYAQRGMWLIERVTGGSPYNLVFVCFVEQGRLEPERFAQAVTATVARHEGLRTVFRERDGEVVRHVLANYTPEVVAVELDGPVDDFDHRVRTVATERCQQSFDVSAAPPLRFLRFEHSSGRQAVVLSVHHMVLDGWSVGLLLKEVFARYDAIDRGTGVPALPPSVPMRALLQHQARQRDSGEWDRDAEFWVKHLDGVPSVLELPSDRQRPHLQDPAGVRTALDLGQRASSAIAEQARRLGITPFALLLGAFGLTLSRWTGARSLLVGVPVLGRGSSELEQLVAVAGNLVPVRIDVDDDGSVDGFLRSVHRSLALSIDAGSLPFEELVARLGIERTLSCHPLVQVCFGMHDQLLPSRLRTARVQVRVEEGHGGGSQFDLTLLVGQSEPSLAGYVEYATSVWDPAEVDGFIADFQATAEQLAAATGTPLADVRCMSPERRALLDAVNDTGREFPAVSIDELFRTVAGRVPDAVAVREGAVELTYAQLVRAAAEQARLLQAAGVRPGDRVLVGLERSVAEAVAVLGTIWAGAAYVGVDLGLPTAHLVKIVSRAAPAAALVPPAAAGKLEPFGVPLVETWDPSWSARAAGTPPASATADRLAYVAFTSGSTGQPKGVAVPHRAVIRLVHQVDYVRLGDGERMLRLSPLAFDASTLEIWGALLTGATLEIHPAGVPSPTELGRFLVERGVTVAWLTAGLFRLVAEFAPDSLGGLRQLLTGGDVVPHDHVVSMLERHPGLVITNGYGPTENTTFTTTHSVHGPAEVDGPLPIGSPIPGTRVYILDDRGRRVPPGAVGELYTGGEGLADGYLGDEAETARSFGHLSPEVPERLYRTGDLVRLDTRGRLRFLGRRDDQVKIRGYRVELAAITDALLAQPRVHDAVVFVTDEGSADKRLVAAVVPAPGATVDAVQLRDSLSAELPSYMVPALWAMVDRIPVTSNGKVDRRALAAVAVAAGQSPRPPDGSPSQPADALRQTMELFAEVTGHTGGALADDADFFAMGGDSLAAVRLMGLVRQRLGVTLRLRDFLRSPTPRGLHALIERNPGS